MKNTMSSSSAHAAAYSLGLYPVSEKLTRGNFILWKAQVQSAIKGARMAVYINPDAAAPSQFLQAKKGDDKDADPILNPEYEDWVAKDQQVPSYILTSCSHEILSQVLTATIAVEAWATIQGMYTSQSRVRLISTRMALATASKGTSTISEYFTKMKSLADEMASVGRCLEDEELVSYILTGLDHDYNPVVSAVAARVEPILVGDLNGQLTSFEQWMELHGSGGLNSSVNMVSRGGRGGFNRGRGGRGAGGRGQKNGGRGGGCGQGGSNNSGVICQLCGKEGHSVVHCFKRFDASFTGPPQKSASSATTSYGIDTN